MMCCFAFHCLLPVPEAGVFVELRRPLKLDKKPDAPLVKPDRLLLLRPPGNAEGSTSPKDCCAIAVTSAAFPPSRELNAPRRSLVPVVNLFCRPCKSSQASVSGGLGSTLNHCNAAEIVAENEQKDRQQAWPLRSTEVTHLKSGCSTAVSCLLLVKSCTSRCSADSQVGKGIVLRVIQFQTSCWAGHCHGSILCDDSRGCPTCMQWFTGLACAQ